MAWMFSTLVSALLYMDFRLSSWFCFFLKKPKIPFSSSAASKLLSSPIRLVIISPTSPRSLVETLDSAASEKSPIFFWLAAPYCSTCWLLVMSIFSAKSSTIFCSSGERRTSSGAGWTGFSSPAGFSSASSAEGSSVRLGAAGISKSKFRLLSAITRFVLSQNKYHRTLWDAAARPLAAGGFRLGWAGGFTIPGFSSAFPGPPGRRKGPCSRRRRGRPAGARRRRRSSPRSFPPRCGPQRRFLPAPPAGP